MQQARVQSKEDQKYDIGKGSEENSPHYSFFVVQPSVENVLLYFSAPSPFLPVTF